MNKKIIMDKKEFIKAIQTLGFRMVNSHEIFDAFPSEFFDWEVVYSYYDYMYKRGRSSWIISKYKTNKFVIYYKNENGTGIYLSRSKETTTSRVQVELLKKIFQRDMENERKNHN